MALRPLSLIVTSGLNLRAHSQSPACTITALNQPKEDFVLEQDIRSRDVIMVLFGAGGDLSQRLIVPALFNLYLDHQLPERFVLLGVDRQELDDAQLAECWTCPRSP